MTLVEAQHSPEVPLAVDALTDLTTLIADVAWQLSGLATACEEYADAVEAARDRTRALLAEVAQMIVEGAAISVIVTGLTGGLGGGATAAAAAARVRSQAPRFYALLTALRAGVATGLQLGQGGPCANQCGVRRVHPGGRCLPEGEPHERRAHRVPGLAPRGV